MKRRSLVVSLLSVSLASCVGTTGGDLLELEAAAAGPPDATGGALAFRSSLGYRIELTKSRLFVGGIFLNRARPTSVSSDTSCTLAGTYVAELLSGREVDLLSPEPQPFPARGFATSERAQTAEVWLTAGDVNRTSSATIILRAAGVAERDGKRYPFEAALTIGDGRLRPATDPALPGQHPICKERIVSPIPVDLAAAPGRRLLLRVDPRGMFANVDFSTLAPSADDVYRFADEAGVDQASDNLYAGMRRPSGVYSFSWLEEK
jgi:hypothetical protein